MENETDLCVSTFIFDNVKEFLNNRNNTYFKTKGTIVMSSIEYQAWQNGVTERANGIIKTMGRSML